VSSNVCATIWSFTVRVKLSCVPVTDVVVLGLPFRFTTEAVLKPFPVTFMVTVEVPATAAVFGETTEILGGAFVIEKGSVLEEPPPGGGFSTPTWIVPADARLVEVTRALSSVLF